MRPRSVLLVLSVCLALALVVSFTHWTFTSGWTFLWFVALVFALLYLPGRILLALMQVPCSPLEHLTLSLAAGIPLSGAAYWLCFRSGAPRLFWVWPVAAVLLSLHPRFRLRLGSLREMQVRYGHCLLLLVVMAAIVPFAFLPLYFENLSRLSDGGLAFYPLADVVAHISIATEVTHTVPPQHPFLPGRMLAYHYGMHLAAAVFSFFGLSMPDVSLRYLPVLFMALTVAAAFCLARSLLASEATAALAGLLVVLGEDLSFVPGLLTGSGEPWLTSFFGMPAVVSLYLLNPMLPALGLLLSCLFCVEKYVSTERTGWLAGATLLGAAAATFKIFATAQLLIAAAATGAVYALLFRRWAMARLTVALGVAILPLLLSTGSSRTDVRIDPWPYVPAMLFRMGIGQTGLGQQTLAFYNGDRSLVPLLAFGAVALPLYLLGTLGARWAGIVVWWKSLARPTPGGSFWFLMAIFVLVGPPLSLILAMTPSGYPARQEYNNAVWFFVQTKYLMWFVALEPLRRMARGRALAVAAILVGLSLPATLQGLVLQAKDAPVALPPAMVEMLGALDREVLPGQTCFAREQVAQVILATTRCRSLALNVFPSASLSPLQQQELRGLRDAFWSLWTQRTTPADAPSLERVLTALGADYLVVDASLGGPPPAAQAEGRSSFWIDERFRNQRFVIFSVRRRSSLKQDHDQGRRSHFQPRMGMHPSAPPR